MTGKVYLIGAGPGDVELLTLAALRIIRQADVVLHDDLVAAEVLRLVSRRAAVVNVGKRCGRQRISQEEINSLLVAEASAGRIVVRLHGGDPGIFGRAGEEITALRGAGIEFEIVPGVTAASAAAASAGIALTDRRLASRLIFLTGHCCREKHHAPWPEIISPDSTVVVYMPTDFNRIARGLTAAGLERSTPCLLVSSASTAQAQVQRTTLAELPQANPPARPKLLIVGAVAARELSQPSAGSLEPLREFLLTS